MSEIEEESIQPEVLDGRRSEIIQTLPRDFKSLVGKEIKIEKEEPQYLIELLGDLLGVTDFKTNVASYWFLDTIALQVLRYKTRLDDPHRSILVSWLAGEFKMIQERRFLREEFFKEMAVAFSKTSESLSLGHPVSYWDQVMMQDSEDDPEKIVEGEEVTGVKSKNEEEIREKEISEVSDLSADVDRILDQSIISKADDLLDVIIEATYDIFGNAFHFAIVRAAFVDPIEVHSYTLPYVLRKLRPVKKAEPDEKVDGTLNTMSGKGRKERAVTKDKKGGKKKVRSHFSEDTRKGSDSYVEVPPPPPSLSEDETLLKQREFILPLIETNEASDIFRTHDETSV